jgi:hypothetical protein
VRPRRVVRGGLLLFGTAVVLGAGGLVALRLGGPAVWVVRLEIAAGAGLVMVLVFGALLGPGARWLAGERRPLDEQERKDLTAKDRVDAVNSARQTLMQSATGLVVIAGVVFTAAGLVYTARTLHTSEQGQITDRYTKAVDQLGSDKLDIRLGGIYALERLAVDSPRDDRTVYDVLTTFAREHAPKSKAKTPDQPTTDIQAALTVIGRRKPVDDGFKVDLGDVHLEGAHLTYAHLSGAHLSGAYLSSAYLFDSDLTYANLGTTDLSGAVLYDANLSGAELGGANLSGAELAGANLSKASLVYVNLSNAILVNAHLSGVNLTGAHLSGVDLRGADLRGADLRGVRGISVEEIHRQAQTDSHTRF